MEDVIRTAIEDVLSDLAIEVGDFSVEHPADLAHGDYAANVALVAAKAAGQNPRELAEKTREKLEGEIEYVIG
jgi:Arginyl-tRNA synthetase